MGYKEMILYCLNNNIPFSKDFFAYLVDFFIEEYKLDDYIKSINISDSFVLDKRIVNNICGLYNVGHKTLAINRAGVDAKFEAFKNSYSFLSANELEIYKFLIYVITTMHEVEHVRQIKIVNEDDKSLESFILKSSYLNTSNNQFFQYIYNLFYKLSPHERMAKIKPLTECFNILQDGCVDIPNLINIIKLQLIREKLYGYQLKSHGPSIEFIHNLDVILKRDSFKNCDWYRKNYEDYIDSLTKYCPSFDKRVTLGVGITEDENKIMRDEEYLVRKLLRDYNE